MPMNKHIAEDEGYKYTPLDDYKLYFYSSDFVIATVLSLKGYELLTITKNESRSKYIFVFKISKSLNDTVKDFWHHRISVDPLEYENHRKNLKSRMFSIFSK